MTSALRVGCMLIIHRSTRDNTMPAANSMAMKRETLNLRIKTRRAILSIERRKLRGKTAQTCAEAALRCRRGSAYRTTHHYGLSRGLSGVSRSFDQTPSPNAALRKTMQTPAPWEQGK